MKSSIRVLVVDDAVVMRKLIADVLSAEPDIEIAGVAAHGRLAVARIPQVNPDCVTLDVEMPEMDGIETLVEIRKHWPRLPVIMFSTLTQRGASGTLEALSRGATDYVTKPSNIGNFEAAVERLRNELVPKIRLHCERVESSRAPQPPPRPAVAARKIPGPPRAVVIASSTGGPNALAHLLPALGGRPGVPIFIVQHMPPVFTAMLAERLNGASALEVREAAGAEVVRPNCVYVAPGGKHMTVRQSAEGPRIELNEDPPENSCRPAADPLFRSVAAAYEGRVLGLVLTGMGQDGLRGAQTLVESGGEVLIQDQETSVVWGMPGAVSGAGLAAEILPLGEIAGAVLKRLPVLPDLRGAAGGGRK